MKRINVVMQLHMLINVTDVLHAAAHLRGSRDDGITTVADLQEVACPWS